MRHQTDHKPRECLTRGTGTGHYRGYALNIRILLDADEREKNKTIAMGSATLNRLMMHFKMLIFLDHLKIVQCHLFFY